MERFVDLPRGQQVSLYAIGIIEDLVDKGVVDGPKLLTDVGRGLFAEARETGFKPTRKELRSAAEAMVREGEREDGRRMRQKVYGARPTQRRARKVWDYATELVGVEPYALWFNPNSWSTGRELVGPYHGWWGAQFYSDTYHCRMNNYTIMIHPGEVP